MKGKETPGEEQQQKTWVKRWKNRKELMEKTHTEDIAVHGGWC